MKEILEQIFALDYTQYKGKVTGNGEEVRQCFKELKNELKPFVSQENLFIDWSIGQFRWAAIPWVRIYDKDISPETGSGVYIVYLFAESGESVFVTLNQGVSKSTPAEILHVKKNIQESIPSGDFAINHGSIAELGDYADSTIYFKVYQKNALPSDEAIKKDLKMLIDMYKKYISSEKGGSATTSIGPILPNLHGETMSLQTIFFGAPGTGKSHKIDSNLFKDKNGNLIGMGLKDIPEVQKFRSTFHPDYAYAQFVGAYKPLKIHGSTVLNKNELIERLKEMKNKGIYPVHKFSAYYFDSLLKLSNAEQAEIIKESDTPESMITELKKGIAVGEFLKNEDSTSITYSFVPQVFAKAYAMAWKLQLSHKSVDKRVFLVIEEINRGNCAQIFGDIFQLLDRDKDGFSQYSIDADCDFAEWLEKEFKTANVWDAYKKEVGGEGKLQLPPNLNILATMNTSDQSLFPMDSAFKRRFDWEYVPINYDHSEADFIMEVGDSKYKWLDFLKKVNADVYDVTRSEDKQMGEFFIKPKDEKTILFEDFRSKVLFYLWDSVYKDETERQIVFHFAYGDGDDKIKSVTFQSLFGKDAKEIVNKIMKNLKVEKVTTT